MKKPASLLAYIYLAIFFTGCNTLYNSRSVNIEIVEPAKVIFPEWVNSVAVRYNNSNVSYNPHFSTYIVSYREITDETNSDSIAAELYYNSFTQSLKNSFLFENINEIEPGNYSGIKLESTEKDIDDSLHHETVAEQAIRLMSELITDFAPERQDEVVKYIDPEYGLYTKENLYEIRDSTAADMLLSLDYFAMSDEIRIKDKIPLFINEYVITWWNFYDLRKNTLQYFYNRTDTISWTYHYSITPGELPDRKTAIENAAKISGQRFAEFLAPHWIPVSRTLYKSGHVELKKAEQLANENNWLEAAEIWKSNTKNPNKNIAAKSMYNLALACEIEGDLDAAIDWVVKSYKIFEQKNRVHEFNCQDYIRILAQRKLDLKKINIQLNQQESGQ